MVRLATGSGLQATRTLRTSRDKFSLLSEYVLLVATYLVLLPASAVAPPVGREHYQFLVFIISAYIFCLFLLLLHVIKIKRFSVPNSAAASWDFIEW